MKKCGRGKSGKSMEEIFQTCLSKELDMVQPQSSHFNALEFYEAINHAKQSYLTELRTLKQKKVM